MKPWLIAISEMVKKKKKIAMAKVEFSNLINHLTLIPRFRSHCLRVSNLAVVGNEREELETMFVYFPLIHRILYIINQFNKRNFSKNS